MSADDQRLVGETLTCSSEGCDRAAVEMLALSGNPGHVHDCSEHAHGLREWCDVVFSAPIIDDTCPAKVCTGNRVIWFGEPTPLGDA